MRQANRVDRSGKESETPPRRGCIPKAFVAARDRYGDRIVQYGYAASREAYIAWLKRGFVAVSTAIQENFGIAMVEAMR